MMNFSAFIRNRSIGALFTLVLCLAGFAAPGYAQDPTPTPEDIPDTSQVDENGMVWNQPINLSRSGSASQPLIMSGDEDVLFAFWWDFYDGITRSTFDGETWSEPDSVAIPTTALDHLPFIIRDSLNRFYAFWFERDEENQVLRYSALFPGSAEWSLPKELSSSVAAYKVVHTVEGGLAVAFIHTQHTEKQPAGVYYSVLTKGSTLWSLPVPVYTSIYFRSIDRENPSLNIFQDQDGLWRIIWREPLNGQWFAAHSVDNGKSWSNLITLGEEFETPANPLMTIQPDGKTMLLWKVGSGIACSYYQQTWEPLPEISEQSLLTENEPSQTLHQANFRSPTPVWPETTICSDTNSFWKDGDQVIWIGGQRTRLLSFSALNPDGRWSAPYQLQVHFRSTEDQAQIELSELSSTLYHGQLAVIGTDINTGDIWTATTRISAIKLVYTPRSPWTNGQKIAEGTNIEPPAIATDRQGSFYMVWEQEDTENQAGSVLFSTYGKEGSPSQSFPIRISSNEHTYARQPSMLIDAEDFIHLSWIEGMEGNLMYQKADPAEIRAAGDWSTPQPLFSAKLASWPQIAMDTAGNIYILYIIPLNENRGVYLLHSPDAGLSWNQPRMVLDAADFGWQIIGRPAFGITPDGILHAAWVHGDVPGSIQSQSIVYAYSKDSGETWSSPLELSGVGYDNPKVALMGGQIHLLFANGSGSIWHRWSDLATDTGNAENWSPAAQVPGFQNTAAQFGAAISGSASSGALHVVGAKTAGSSLGYSTLVYSVWFENHWQVISEPLPEVRTPRGLGISTTAYSRGGNLAISWLVQDMTSRQQETKSLYLVARQVTGYVDPDPASVKLPIREIIPTSTAEIDLLPPPTPDPTEAVDPVMHNLNSGPEPLVLSGALVFIALITVIGFQWFVRRDR